MAWKKGSKVIQLAVPEILYTKIKDDAEKSLLFNSVPKYVLNILVKHYEDLDKNNSN